MRAFFSLGLVAAASLVGICAACNDDGDGSEGASEYPEPSTDGPIVLEDYLVVAGRLRCQQVYKCCSAEAINSQVFMGESEEECVTLSDGIARSSLTDWVREAVDSGRMKYDPQAMKDCYDKLAAIDCSVTDHDWTCIERALSGLVPLGAECKEDDSECAEGRCNLDTHRCEPWAELGEACEFNDDCVSGSCTYVDNVCQPRAAEGETCYFDYDCVSHKCDTEANVCAPPEHDNGCPADGRVLDSGTPTGP